MRRAGSSLRPNMDGLLLRGVTLIGVLLIAVVVGLVMRRRSGRVREVTDGERLGAGDLAAPLGVGATFVQFSSPACSSCRSVRRVLSEIVAGEPGLAHIEI